MVLFFIKSMGLDGSINIDKYKTNLNLVAWKYELQLQIVFTRNNMLDIQVNKKVVHLKLSRTNINANPEPNYAMHKTDTVIQKPGPMM